MSVTVGVVALLRVQYLHEKKKYTHFLLLMAMSLQVLHAYAIDALDTHACEVSEYVVEFSQPISDDIAGDICNIHAEFHNTFLVPENLVLSKEKQLSQSPQSFIKIYKFTSNQNLLRPPRI